jgi:hypothetical protein
MLLTTVICDNEVEGGLDSTTKLAFPPVDPHVLILATATTEIERSTASSRS